MPSYKAAHASTQAPSKADLKASLTNTDEFLIVFQPIVCLLTGKTHAVECLLRWQHPKLGTISPQQTIALAHKHDLIDELGWWIVNYSLAIFSQAQYYSPVARLALCSINVSPRQ